MTVTTNAQIAGFTFLIYIAAGIASLVLAGNAPATAVLSCWTWFFGRLGTSVQFESRPSGRHDRRPYDATLAANSLPILWRTSGCRNPLRNASVR